METGNPHKDAHWSRWLLLIWGVMSALLIAFRWQNIDFFILADTDDNLRLAQVKAWLGGQAWSDLRQYKLNPPMGADIHWSRIPDLPIAAIMLLLEPFMGWVNAQKAAIALAPLIPFGLALYAHALTVRRLVDPRAWPLAAAILMSGASLLTMFAPTRIDHHGWQLAFLALTLTGLFDEKRLRGGLTTGCATALSLSVGLEMLPYLALCGGVIGLRWIMDAGQVLRLRAYGIALAGGTALGFALFASQANHALRCDALTPVWLSTMVLAGAMLTILSYLPARHWAVRLICAGGAALGLAGFFYAAWPQCLARPEGISDELYRTWFVNITEVRPLYVQSAKTAVTAAALPVAGLVGAVSMLWLDRAKRVLWMQVALLSLVSVLMMFWQMRAAPAAQFLAVPGAVGLAWTLLLPLARARRLAVRMVMPPIIFLLLSGLIGQLVMAVWPAPEVKTNGRAVIRNASARCATLSALRPVAALPPATIFTFVDLSPRLINVTGHSAISGPYHRNGDAILDVFRVFRGTPDEARRIITAHGATYLLICPNMAEGANHKKFAPKGFLAQLERGQVPDWLTPVALPTTSPLRLWRIVPSEGRQN